MQSLQSVAMEYGLNTLHPDSVGLALTNTDQVGIMYTLTLFRVWWF